MNRLSRYLLSSWSRPNVLTVLLIPLSGLYCLLSCLRKYLYRIGVFSAYRSPLPVIVVGNLTVGGTGKTPLVIYLVEQLQKQGWQPAVISRGYKSSANGAPHSVRLDDDAREVGDEPLLIVKRTGVPVVVGPNRKADVEHVLTHHPECDVVISDDGLQHLALQRDIEICIIDAAQKTNRLLLPAGPFRESLARLKAVDFIVDVGANQIEQPSYDMTYLSDAPVNLLSGDKTLHQGATVNAVAGIGKPEKFFQTCRELGFDIIEQAFADHHAYTPEDLQFDNAYPIIMTEKDAVKCASFNDDRLWYLPISARLPDDFIQAVTSRLKSHF